MIVTRRLLLVDCYRLMIVTGLFVQVQKRFKATVLKDQISLSAILWFTCSIEHNYVINLGTWI